MVITLLRYKGFLRSNYQINFVQKCRNKFFSQDKIFTESFSRFGKKTLTEHQKNIMARSLPVKKKLENVKNVVLIASGKGGVGKSTCAVNLAIALKAELGNREVGLLDMDVFGPSLPIMMNLHRYKVEHNSDRKFIPLTNYGVHCMSFGFLLPEDAAVVWRGPMVMSCVQQLSLNTAWPSLHTLLLDLPPGTGDVALSITQLIEVTGAVLITTPQNIALADVVRGADMFNKVSVPILGVVQNMSVHKCSQCGHQEHIFGRDGAVKLSEQLGVPVLGDVPVSVSIREGGDVGSPAALIKGQSGQATCFGSIAKKLLERIEVVRRQDVSK